MFNRRNNSNKHKMKIQKRLFIIRLFSATLLFSFSLVLSAQGYMKEKRIYLLDVTGSMSGFGGSENIFDSVKNQLISAINEVDESNTEIEVIPYADKPGSIITGSKEDVISKLSNIKATGKNTNIDAAWRKGVSRIDNTRVNYMFLLTDGKHNSGPTYYSFCQTICDWKNVSLGKYVFAFYVMLTHNAEDETIQKIAEETPQMWSIKNMNVNVTFVLMPFKLRLNTFNGGVRQLRISRCNHFGELAKVKNFSVILDKNPYYKLESATLDTKKHKINFKILPLKPQKKLPVSTTIKAKIVYNQKATPLMFFTPDNFEIVVENRGKRKMKFYQDEEKASINIKEK